MMLLDLLKNMTDLDPEFNEIVSQNFWDIIGSDNAEERTDSLDN